MCRGHVYFIMQRFVRAVWGHFFDAGCTLPLAVLQGSINRTRERSFLGLLRIFNPHQRCGYSDSTFARILFYTAGSRNGLKGWTSGLETTKIVMTRQIRIQKVNPFYAGSSISGWREAFGTSPGKTARKRSKNSKMQVWARRAILH